MKTFDSFSFGCRVNQAEMEALDRELMQKGYEKQSKQPDIYILNTCSVTHKAEREARKHIYNLKRQFPDTKIVVTGCAATNWSKTNTKVGGVDYLIDNKSKELIAELLEKKYNHKIEFPQVEPVKTFDEPTESTATDKFMRSKRVIIKIQDGCHRFCSFCIVPYLRGLPQSTKIEDIVKQIHSYPEYVEAILTAINTEAYGRDTGETFVDLVETILTKTDISRISFGSIHPWTFQDDFFNLYRKYAQSNRFVDFFHIPLQAGSDNMLKLMKRGYTRDEFIEKLNMLKDINEFAFIGTDVIVGFLEETDQDFEDTYSFLEKTPISRFHVFRFSRREHTAAYYLSKRLKQPSPAVKKARSQRLRDLSDKKYAAFQEIHVGKTFETLILERREGDYQHGLLTNQMLVRVKTEKDFTGDLKNVRIYDYRNGELFGKIV
ncbi:MiaB/RimO family radical SAM methylthiotransferase [Candidatus Roizmanbacteria bacterium]|nr:MAG: MiaB/RimO family radical SAM methylthiotransferase [Candidatus Roizmanbacteria bacterium]